MFCIDKGCVIKRITWNDLSQFGSSRQILVSVCMSNTNFHLAWFKGKCPYLLNSQTYKKAYDKLNNATYYDLQKLRAEFEDYDDCYIPLRQYEHKGRWYANQLFGCTPPKLNMVGIQQKGRKWYVQQRRDAQLRKWIHGFFKRLKRKGNWYLCNGSK